jgi:hypothetical protein
VNKILFTALMMVAALVSMLIPVPADAQTMSTISKGTPLNTSARAITGFSAPATPTLTLSSAAAVRMSALPANTIAVTVVASGAVNFGGSTVKTSTDGVYRTISTGAETTFDVYPGTPQPDIWFIPNATGAANITVRFIAHTQR